VARAAPLPDSEPATLAARARSALAARDADAARDWLHLGAMRGDPELAIVEEALWLALEGERAEALRMVAQRAPHWSQAMRVFSAGQ